MTPIPVFVLTGPTASGKAEVAAILAAEHGAEIALADSIKIYRGMDVGSAKPSAATSQGLRYHLANVADPSELFDVARFVRLAETAIHQIHQSGKKVLVVGGTGLYLKALLQGIFTGAPRDDALRAELTELARERGTSHLYEMLEQVDPRAAARIHPNDEKRLVRALETYRLTGKPISQWQTQFGRYREEWEPRIVCLVRQKEDLKRRIRVRIEKMFGGGLVEETDRLRKIQPPPRKEVLDAIGYREAFQVLEGKMSPAEAIENTVRRTWHFSRKQMTWFRSFPGLRWLEVAPTEDASDTAQRVAREFGWRTAANSGM